ncbi:tail fiber protein [Polaribacter sp. SA4-12]|uniref:tail fiber protein n=1 Tax=Polaribacter sp. SA4-12 TaxID=1312072 RepID=UPI000B3C3C0E|nr:tail fiber protein [Polaribacter sp. SA4-12]ARV15312.1 hypothetical protein BTO07_09245 [Polaribacter sp. SA4-12]
MKKFYNTLLFLFITTISFAQGIAIQGIARDNASSAITDTNLTFTFSITKNDNTVLYSETQAIKTDNFGVFSHIVSTGNPTTSAFNNVDFSITNLKMKVLVVYEGNTIEVYNQTFQYTPYAFFAQKAALATNATNADDGVPTGAIMPYSGTTAPEGWVLCDGQSLTSITGSAALIALVGNTAPNLQGTFLRGTGLSPTNGRSGPGLGTFQTDTFRSHLHGSGSLFANTAGSHTHAYQSGAGDQSGIDGGGWNSGEIGYRITNNTSSNAGSHGHVVSGSVGSTGDTETRPVNYGVNYIIKL